MGFARFVLTLASASFGIFGVAYFVVPAPVTALFDISLGSATADNDVRAIYGGVGLGLAIFFFTSASRPDWFKPALWVVLLTLAGTVMARIVSWFVAGLPGPIAHLYHGTELIGVVLASLAIRKLSQNRAPAV